MFIVIIFNGSRDHIYVFDVTMITAMFYNCEGLSFFKPLYVWLQRSMITPNSDDISQLQVVRCQIVCLSTLKYNGLVVENQSL